jgi:membrane protein DedA with SNARE-associated domain
LIEATAFIDQFPYGGIFLLLILGEIGFPFPEDATLILSGFLTAHEVIKPLPAFFVVYSGLLITDFLLYLAGKKYGRSIVEHKRFHKIISPDRLSKLEEKFGKWGGQVVFLGRHVWGIRAQVFLVAGVMKLSSAKFVAADAASALFSIGLWGGVGYVGGNSLRILKKDVTSIEHIAVVVLTLLVLAGVIFRYFRNNRKSKTKPF